MLKKMLPRCLIPLLCLVLFFPVAGCGGAFTGSSNIETREMDYTDFNKLEVSSDFEVDITRGDAYFVSITANDNLFQQLDIHQSGKTLHIGLKQPGFYIQTTQIAAIVMPDLYRLNLSGSSEGRVRGFSMEHRLEFGLSGDSLLKLEGITAGDTDFDLSGASEASGRIEMANCNLIVSGASTVDLAGSATDISIEASGASTIKLADLPVENARVDMSEASNATVSVRGRLDGNLSGASVLYYRGNPTLGTLETSGGSRIEKK